MQTAHIQAVVTEKKHPRLVKWWNEAVGDKSATVRLALEWFFDIKPRLDRIERMLEVLIKHSNARERIAAFCHDSQWCGRTRYQFKIGTFNDDGTWTMPAWAVERWTRQAETPYAELSEDEKENDRREADRFLELIGAEQ